METFDFEDFDPEAQEEEYEPYDFSDFGWGFASFDDADPEGWRDDV